MSIYKRIIFINICPKWRHSYFLNFPALHNKPWELWWHLVDVEMEQFSIKCNKISLVCSINNTDNYNQIYKTLMHYYSHVSVQVNLKKKQTYVILVQYLETILNNKQS